MSQRDSDKPPASEVVPSLEVETPRGGFMARPGLKAPPKHAVVVRGGDVPESDDIPLARASFLPPPPSEPAPDSASEKITLRAIPSPRPAAAQPILEATSSAAVTPLAAHEPTLLPQVLDSFPPPSDAPVVASVVERSTPVPRSRVNARARRSWLTIVAAAMAGLVLGIISVVTTVSVQQADVAPAAQPAGVELAEAPASEPQPQPARVEAATSAAAAAAAPPASAAANEPTPAPPSVNQPAARPRPPAAAKRSIF